MIPDDQGDENQSCPLPVKETGGREHRLTSSTGHGSHSPKGRQTRSPVVAWDSYRCLEPFKGLVDDDPDASEGSALVKPGKKDREREVNVIRLSVAQSRVRSINQSMFSPKLILVRVV